MSVVLHFRVTSQNRWSVLEGGKEVATISKCVDELAALDMTRKGYRNNGRFAVKWHSRNRLVRGGVNAWIATS